MHILYLHQYFALPQGSTGTRSYELARRWVKAGHQVTLICGVTDQSGVDPKGQKRIEIQTEGIRVLALNTKYSNSLSFVARVWAFVKFMLLSFWVALKIKDVDMIYATSTPLTIGIPAMLLKWFKRVPFIFEVRDQWPQIPIEMGYIRSPLLKKFLLWLEKRIYKSSVAIVALSPGMAKGAREVLGPIQKDVIIASNSSDTQLFHPDVDGSQIRIQQGWQDKFVVLHFGAMGRANGLDFLIDAAQGLKGTPEIHFVIIGEGSEKPRLRSRIEELGLKNIEILDTFPKKKMPEIVAACNVSTVVFANYPILEHNSANKFFDSISAAKPILLNYSGWQRDIIEQNECGFGCTLYDIKEYTDKLLNLYENRETLFKMGQNGRKLAEAEFDRDLISNRILTMIENVNSQHPKK